jgi:outer membrane lipoprotein LolB
MRPRACSAFASAAIFVLTSALLSGCAGVPGGTYVASPSANAFAAKPRWTAFSLDGRIAVHQGENTFAGNIRWRHSAQSDEIDLASPLGQTVARLVRAADGIHLAASDGRETMAPDWESLTERELGWSLPVSGLVHWVQSAAAPAARYEVTAADDQGRPRELRQQGWTIAYLAYDEQDRPTRLRLSRNDLDLRLAVDSWQTGATQPAQ